MSEKEPTAIHKDEVKNKGSFREFHGADEKPNSQTHVKVIITDIYNPNPFILLQVVLIMSNGHIVEIPIPNRTPFTKL